MRNFAAPTVNETVLLHLRDYSKFMEHFVVPFSATQDGIAEAIDIARPHVSRAIKELKGVELVFEKKARVENSDRKRKVYFLTGKGTQEIKRLKDGMLYLEVAYSRIPTTPDFTGRKKELRKIKAWANSGDKVLVVQGALGIGKSSLVSRFAASSVKQILIFWHSVRKTDTAGEILSNLGDLLYTKNNNVLRYYLLSSIDINYDKVVKILGRNLSNAILIFDDCEKMSKDVINFVNKMVNTLSDMTDVKMIFITEDETQLSLKWPSKDLVHRLKLKGLEMEEVKELLKEKGFSDDMYELTKGHPLFLKLVGPDCNPHGDVQTYFKSYIKTNLSKEERKLMEVASVYRAPFKAKALFVEAGIDYEAMTRLSSKSLLTEVSNDIYVVHEFIKEYFYSSLTEAKKKNIHKKVAEHYLEAGDSDDIIEAIHHFVASQKFERAADTAISSGISLIEKGYFTELEKTLGEIVEEKIDDLKLAEILVLKGHLQKVRGNWDRALDNYQTALGLYEKHEMTEKSADTHRLMGAIYKDKGDYTEALDKFRWALDLLQDRKNEISAKIYDDIGTVWLRKGEFDKAGREILKGLEIANNVGNEKQTALNNLTLGNLYLSKQNWDKAKQAFRKSVGVFDRARNLRMLAVCYNNIAITYYKTGDTKKANDYWQKSLSISEKIGDIRVMLSYTNLGFITYKKGEWMQTEEYCKKALNISENIDNAIVSSAAYSILGHININRRNFPECVEYYEKALKLRERDRDKSKIISSKNDLAHAYLIDGHIKKAKNFADMALKMAMEMEKKEECARAHLNVGNCLIQMQEFEEAKDRFSNALKISNQIKNKSLTGKIYLSIGELYINEKEYLAAERHLKDGAQIFEELEEHYELALCLIHLARSYKESGTEDSRVYFEKGKDLLCGLNAEKAINV